MADLGARPQSPLGAALQTPLGAHAGERPVDAMILVILTHSHSTEGPGPERAYVDVAEGGVAGGRYLQDLTSYNLYRLALIDSTRFRIGIWQIRGEGRSEVFSWFIPNDQPSLIADRNATVGGDVDGTWKAFAPEFDFAINAPPNESNTLQMDFHQKRVLQEETERVCLELANGQKKFNAFYTIMRNQYGIYPAQFTETVRDGLGDFASGIEFPAGFSWDSTGDVRTGPDPRYLFQFTIFYQRYARDFL